MIELCREWDFSVLVFEGRQITGLVSRAMPDEAGTRKVQDYLFVCLFFKVKLNYDEPGEIK